MTPYQEGYNAYWKSKDNITNPYGHQGTKARQWDDGWWCAQNECEMMLDQLESKP